MQQLAGAFGRPEGLSAGPHFVLAQAPAEGEPEGPAHNVSERSRQRRTSRYPATRFHDLRHTYVTLVLEQGTNIKTVSSSLAHATVAFTLDVYGHVDEKMQQDSADRMQAFLEALQ